MQAPNEEQVLYAQLALLSPMVDYIRDNLKDSEFDDLELISYMDKARFMLKGAKIRMDELIKQSQEPTRVCY